MRILSHALFVALVFFVPVCGAVPVVWSVSGFAPGLTSLPPYSAPGFAGTFTYDAATGQVSALNIHDCIQMDCGTLFAMEPSTTVSIAGSSVEFEQSSSAITFGLILQLDGAITAAGANLNILPGSCTFCSGPGFNTSDFSGSGFFLLQGAGGYFIPVLSGSVSASPEPPSARCVCLALSLLAVIRFRKPTAG